jgi:peroxiredoxin family protein
VTRRLVVVLLNTDPRNVEELAAPFYYAAVAAAMDHEVDVLCTATAGKLLFKGVADKLHVKPGDPKTVYEGALFFISADAAIFKMLGVLVVLGATFLWVTILLLRRVRWHND